MILAVLVWHLPLVVLLPGILVFGALWMDSFVVRAWRLGDPYSLMWGVSDGHSALDGRIRLDNIALYPEGELASYRWSFRRDIRDFFRLGT